METIEWTTDGRTNSRLLIGTFVVGVLLSIATYPGSPLGNGSLRTVTIFGLPVVIAALAYTRSRGGATAGTIALLVVWGGFAIAIAAFVTFLATMGQPGGRSSVLWTTVRQVALFLAGVVGLGGTFLAAGIYRAERPVVSFVALALGPVAVIVLYALVVSII